MTLDLKRLWPYASIALGGLFAVGAMLSLLAGRDIDPITKAQPRLTTLHLLIGSKGMIAEIATTPREVATGLMFRQSMGADEGMLFVFDRSDRRSFWMKNCDLPLSAAYIGPDGKILEIHDLEPNNTNPVVSQSDSVQYVLEAPRGWFATHQIGAGAAVASEGGQLPKGATR
jgi:uncharacterized membrane protein (UPF0127 family)